MLRVPSSTVSSFVRGDPDRAETILADLSQLLRTSLRERTRPLVPVADEIEFIERYLAIEGTRFEDRLKVELEADAEALNARIPSLLLQPLVENAIKHGVSRSRGPATLTVRIGRDGDELKVVIENSYRAGEQGIGNGNGSGESVGLRNVRERLDTLYAARHRFHSGPQGDTWRVEIGLPFEQDPVPHIELGLVEEVQQFIELGIGFAGKAGDEGAAYRDVRTDLAPALQAQHGAPRDVDLGMVAQGVDQAHVSISTKASMRVMTCMGSASLRSCSSDSVRSFCSSALTSRSSAGARPKTTLVTRVTATAKTSNRKSSIIHWSIAGSPRRDAP